MTIEDKILFDGTRQSIQEIDEMLLELLEKRTDMVGIIGKIKEDNDLPIYVPEVEKKKIAALAQKCKHLGLVETIWPVIMCYSRSVE